MDTKLQSLRDEFTIRSRYRSVVPSSAVYSNPTLVGTVDETAAPVCSFGRECG